MASLISALIDPRFGPIVPKIILSQTTEAMKVMSQDRPPPLTLPLAVLDTGACQTAIRSGLGAQLGLNPCGDTTITTPSCPSVLCDCYAVRIVFPNQAYVEVLAVELPAAIQHIPCLIGRDVFSNAIFIYDGPANVAQLFL